MKKIVFAAMALLVLQFGPAQAADSKSGTILLPTPIVGSGEGGAIGDVECEWVSDPNCEKGNFAGLHRRLYLVGGEAANGVFGVTFPVTATNVTFTLNSVPANTADFDITFYKDLGALPNTAPAPYCDPAPCSPKSNFAKLGNGAETGTVPAGTKWAIVTCTCVNATFQYTAG